MPRVALILFVAVAFAGCGEDKSAEFIPRSQFKIEAPKEAGPDPNFKPFPKDDPKVVTLPSGVKYLELVPGTEHGKAAPENATVRVAYQGWLENGVSFDSSFKNPSAQPGQIAGTTEFSLNGVVAGWKEGLTGMKEGAKRLLWIPAEKGYGARGQGSIPPNSNLIFEVALFNVVDTPGATDDDHAGHGH
jgi:FKBP-type peptidyl-prolyl cis-trans isomerase